MKYNIIIVILTLLLLSCEKEETHRIDPEFKSYFASYKDGSWWLLEDSMNLKLDSLYILDYIEKRESSGPKSKEYYEIIEYKLYSNEKISRAYCGVENSGATCFGLKNVDLSTPYFSSFPGICKSNIVENPNCFGCGFEIINNYHVNSFVFSDVIKIWNQADTFFYAKDVGLIQYSNEIFNYCIVDYDLVK